VSIHNINMWEELVRIREVLALDSYARQLEQCKDFGFLDKNPKIAKQLANDLDECRMKMRAYAYPMEHL